MTKNIKVGIMTIFYRNYNYGANLQAYALYYICKSLGVDVELINYYDNTRFHRFLSDIKQSFKNIGKHDFKRRKKRIDEFRKTIPQSKVFFSNTVVHANSKYDCFIVGSDQVWNPSSLNNAYKLSFLNDDKIKASYAASIGRETLNEYELELFGNFLKSFDYVSVREKQSINMLTPVFNGDIICTLDPTLLLSQNEWENIASKRIIDSKYLFCYFLNGDSNFRSLANEYAKMHKLTIVTLPNLSYSFRKSDDGFGDYQVYDAGIPELLSFIKNADFIFTDSFHISVFSCIFKKEFVVFKNKGSTSGARMLNLVSFFDIKQRFADTDDKKTLNYINSLKKIDYSFESDYFKKMKIDSIDFIKKVISNE